MLDSLLEKAACSKESVYLTKIDNSFCTNKLNYLCRLQR